MRIKKWLFDRFLPAWCKDSLKEENAMLRAKLEEAKRENLKLAAYIDGMHTALRYQGRKVKH